jgi:hypothetical protein
MSENEVAHFLLVWRSFFGFEGSAAATLLGLLFVAVSLNADLILAGDRPNTKQLAEQAFQNYIAAFLISTLFLLPVLTLQEISAFLETEGPIMLIWSTLRVLRTGKTSDSGFSLFRTWLRLLPSLIAYAGLLVIGISINDGLTDHKAIVIAGASIILVISATRTSWDLLVRIAQIRHTMERDHS